MAHNIHLNGETGNYDFLSMGNQTAWHGLGTVLEQKYATAADVIKHIKIDYEVAKADLSALVNGINVPVKGKQATYRKDTGAILGVVGNRYSVVQNTQGFEFFDSIVADGEAIYTTAGVLGAGERIFLCAQMPNYVKIEGTNDITKVYVVLTMSHNGEGAIKALITPVRVVCQNTLNAALRQHTNMVSITHRTNAVENLREAHKVLGITNNYITEFNTIANRMADFSIKDSFADEVITAIFAPDQKEGKDFTPKKLDRLNAVKHIYLKGAGQSEIIGTAWGLYNGITHFFSHNMANVDDNSKFLSVLEGDIRKQRQIAFDMIADKMGTALTLS